MITKGMYQHFKGQFYKVLEVATHSETTEPLVIYQALYGNKGIWARPVSMFSELVERNGDRVPRFSYVGEQSEVLEMAVLNLRTGTDAAFEQAFAQAQGIIASMPGYISHQLQRCVEQPGRYLLLVEWQSLEHHTVGFRESEEYQQWKELLHDFYQPIPQVQHFRKLANS